MLNSIPSVRFAVPSATPDLPKNPHEAAEDGWLGQVPPPPDPPAGGACAPKPQEPIYANPGMAPDPWISPPPLFPDDPTLFG